MILIVNNGRINSSIKNNTLIEGIAKNKRIKTGNEVQIVSKASFFKIKLFNLKLFNIKKKVIVKNDKIKSKINIA